MVTNFVRMIVLKNTLGIILTQGRSNMDNTEECSWCFEPIKKGCSYISTDNGDLFCSYYCFEKYAYDYLGAETNILGEEEED